MSDLILRWCLGIQDTTKLSSYEELPTFNNIVWLAKLSVASFQKWFPNAHCILLFNGNDIDSFKDCWNTVGFDLFNEVEIISQRCLSKKFENPYHFFPQGVWWKWVPFRWDNSCDEISIDTDIICINEPLNWYNWLENKNEIIVAPERFKEIVVNTCGDFYNHPILKNKTPVNCGIVGHKAKSDFSEQFYEITRLIRYGHTHDSLFITEQGAINVWVYSLVANGIKPYILDFERCAWVRDFIYYLEKGVKVETIHATTWHKKVAKNLKSVLEKRIFKECKDDEFLSTIIESANEFDFYSKHLIRRQIGEDRHQREFYF